MKGLFVKDLKLMMLQKNFLLLILGEYPKVCVNLQTDVR